jgi:regulator of sigma E protease
MSLAIHLLQFVGILSVLVILHELGHMWVAKWSGMRVEKFSLFFGKPLAKFQKGETEYAIGWLPAGGYVKINGMVRGEEMPEGQEHRAYYNAPTWKRVATILAGPAVNIALAFVLLTVMFWTGVPTSVNRIDTVTPGSPAAAIGLLAGDQLRAVDGQRAGDVLAVRELLTDRPGQRVDITYARNGSEFTKSATLLNDAGQGRLGFQFAREMDRSGPIEGIANAADTTWFVIDGTRAAMWRAITGTTVKEFNSVVGIGAAYDEVANEGVSQIIFFAALISLALGIFNLLPFLPLDGGHIVFALLEKLKGSPFSRQAFERASMIGLAVMVIFSVFIIQNDIINISNGTLLQPR